VGRALAEFRLARSRALKLSIHLRKLLQHGTRLKRPRQNHLGCVSLNRAKSKLTQAGEAERSGNCSRQYAEQSGSVVEIGDAMG
jgi:hypothetical protein